MQRWGVLLRGYELRGVLRDRPMRHPDDERSVRGERRRLRSVRTEPRVRHARQVRVRCEDVPERLLRCHRQMPDIEQRDMRYRRRCVYRLQHHPSL